MRLTAEEVRVIKSSVKQFDENAEVYLFGSRVDDRKKGGDIDLFVKSEKLRQTDAFSIKESIWDIIGEQKIDIIIDRNEDAPFLKIALKEKVKL